MNNRWTDTEKTTCMHLYKAGLSPREISEIVGRSRNAVISHIHRTTKPNKPKPSRMADAMRKRWSDPVWREKQRAAIVAGLAASPHVPSYTRRLVFRDASNVERPQPWHPLRDNEKLKAVLGL